MIAYITIITTYSSVPEQNRVIVRAKSNEEIYSTIATMAESVAKKYSRDAQDQAVFTIKAIDTKRISEIDEDLHYEVKLHFNVVRKSFHASSDSPWHSVKSWHDEWESHNNELFPENDALHEDSDSLHEDSWHDEWESHNFGSN